VKFRRQYHKKSQIVEIQIGKNPIKKEVTMDKRIITFTILISLFVSCNSLFINKTRSYKTSQKLINECVEKWDTGKDTIKLKSNRVCIKRKSNRLEIGKIKNNKKIGKWYYYDKLVSKDYKCYLIVKKIKNDSIIIYSSRMINYRKW